MGILTFEAVRQLGLALPEVVEGTAYGAPALELRSKLLACIPVNKSAEANSLAVRAALGRRAGGIAQSDGSRRRGLLGDLKQTPMSIRRVYD